MARVYAPPAELRDAPQFYHQPIDDYNKAFDEWIAEQRALRTAADPPASVKQQRARRAMFERRARNE